MKQVTRGTQAPIVSADGSVDLDHPLNKRLVGWWDTPAGIPGAGSRLLNLCSGSLRNAYNGTLSGQTPSLPMWGAAADRRALLFDGVTNSVSFPTQGSVLPLSVAAMVYPTSTNEGAVFWKGPNPVASATGVYLTVIGDGVAKATSALSGASNSASGGFVPLNRWSHVAAVWTSGTRRDVYVNGVLVGTDVVSRNLTSAPAIFLGRTAITGLLLYFAGGLTNVRFWTRALTTPEVRDEAAYALSGYAGPGTPRRWVTTRTVFIPSTGGVVSGSGTAAGTNTATGVAVTRPQLSGTAAGTNLGTAVAQTRCQLVGVAAGTNGAAGASDARWQAAGVAAGTNTATGVSAIRLQGSGTAAGTNTVVGVSAARARSVGSAAGTNTATGTSQARAAATGSATGAATATGASDARWQASGTAAGTNTATGYAIDGNAPPAWMSNPKLMLRRNT